MRKRGFHPMFGKGIFTTDGADWEHSRAMLRPNFVRSQVGDLATFETHISHLIDAIPTDGSTVDLQDLFFDLTLDSATEFLFGESANSLLSRGGPPGDVGFSEAFTFCTAKIGKNLRVGLVVGIQNRQFEECKNIVHDFTDRYVQNALDHYRLEQSGKVSPRPSDRYVFLHELAKQTQDPIALRSESLNILLAGRDTTASLLSNLWNTISKRPDVWAKLQAEVDELEGKKPSFEEMKNMKYLRYCLNESLRLFPVVPTNARLVVRDTVLPLGGGPDGKSPIFVPKGTTVSYSVYATHRREDIYGPDASEFKPERWETIRPGWEYLPFNGGPRICLGQQFALSEASYATIRIMQTFRTVESRDPEPWQEYLTLTCSSAHGAKVVLRR
jgi:cytochrome P450